MTRNESIIKMKAAGATNAAIGIKLGLTRNQVSGIVYRQTIFPGRWNAEEGKDGRTMGFDNRGQEIPVSLGAGVDHHAGLSFEDRQLGRELEAMALGES
jgi:hypothetical protein